ncbi:DUF3849 domain-containing protein [[Clostridium] hylemonae]|uniref:DUF3849 domain-containing protein n=1 Tax=[Clostridium] hylemonae TaxID=89153 RepID=UPI001FCBAE63|nr:DUF3849 domain-containing protein [[Clostridium] hylemonae]BDF03544.1 hypothetical protein CE91St63_06060 [[Clostridium] hylemonae]
MNEQIPLYLYPGRYAGKHGELEQYRASYRANVACKEAIEQSIAAHYGDNRLNPACVEPVVEQFGFERIFYVLANTVKQKDWDGRIFHDNKAQIYFLPRRERRMHRSRKRNLPCVIRWARPPGSRRKSPDQNRTKARSGKNLKI